MGNEVYSQGPVHGSGEILCTSFKKWDKDVSNVCNVSWLEPASSSSSKWLYYSRTDCADLL